MSSNEDANIYYFCDRNVRVGQVPPAYAQAMPYSRLILVREGALRVTLNDAETVCEAGGVVIANAYELFSVCAVGESARYDLVSFKPSFLPLGLQNFFLGRLNHNRMLKDARLIAPETVREEGLDDLIDRLFACQGPRTDATDFLVSGYITLILGKLVKLIDMHSQNEKNDTRGDSFCEKASSILSYIHENYVRLDEKTVSGTFDLSYSYFSRIFKKAMGMTFNEYVNFLKVNEAKRLLAETPLSVNRIAQRLDFSSASHLINVFRKHASCSPLQFRKHYAALRTSEDGKGRSSVGQRLDETL